jgi:hypothetical protein
MSWKNSIVSDLLKKTIEDYVKEQSIERCRTLLKGPYYCDKYGVSIDDPEVIADPKYDPYIRFSLESNFDGVSFCWVYHPESDTYWKRTFDHRELDNKGSQMIIIQQSEIPDWILEEIFQRDIELYRSFVNNWAKFMAPLIKQAWPQVTAQQLVSVQPMTGPVGGISFYRPRYAQNSGKSVQ